MVELETEALQEDIKRISHNVCTKAEAENKRRDPSGYQGASSAAGVQIQKQTTRKPNQRNYHQAGGRRRRPREGPSRKPCPNRDGKPTGGRGAYGVAYPEGMAMPRECMNDPSGATVNCVVGSLVPYRLEFYWPLEVNL